MTVSVRDEDSLDYLQILLPSDPAWRTKNYLKLVERQRAINAALKDEDGDADDEEEFQVHGSPVVTPHSMTIEDDSRKQSLASEIEVNENNMEVTPPSSDKRLEHFTSSSSLLSQTSLTSSKESEDENVSSPMDGLILDDGSSSVFWTPDDLINAAKLLISPSGPTPDSLLTDIEQMRRVFTLIYDVLRYKSVLEEALNSVSFYERHPQLTKQKQLIWLLFYDMYKRDFQSRYDDFEIETVNGYELSNADSSLFENRVKLGATLSKMRIKNKAYDLENLLPSHLQSTRRNIDDSVISGWINYFKITPEAVFNSLHEIGFLHLPAEKDILTPLTYKLDHLLPRYIHCRPTTREEFVHTSLFLQNNVIMQERTFCLAPAIVAQTVSDFVLTGSVVQTHVSSLPTIAYLANLLATNERIEELLVFGAGERKNQCEKYLEALGVSNTVVYSEPFSQLYTDQSNILENVIGVLATPPNSNSNVFDPVDLAVARGGDLDLLKQLTNDTLHDTSSTNQVLATVLNEQRDTLRVAMSKPQIQFVVYETHSRYDVENSNTVVRAITEMNGYATEKHLEEMKHSHHPDESSQQQTETDDNLTSGINAVNNPPTQVQIQQSTDIEDAPVQKLPSVVVPPCDLFELATLPDLCPEFDECLNTDEQGTYIAVIKRKEITRLDPKYMIQMAESRGLFGSKGDSARQRHSNREMRKKAAMRLQRSNSSDPDKKDKMKIKIEIDRIAAPTHSSNLRDKRHPKLTHDELICQRHLSHINQDESSKEEAEINYPRKWWQELSRYILTWGLYCDPSLPRLKLTRPKRFPSPIKKRVKIIRPPFPVHVNYIEFNSDDSDTDCIQICPCLILSSHSNSLFTGVS